MSAKPKNRGRKSIARGHHDRRRSKRSRFVMFVGRFDRKTFAGIKATAKELKVSTAEALRRLTRKGLGFLTETAAPASKAAAVPSFVVTGRGSISVRAGARIGRRVFAEATPIRLPSADLEIGADYGIVVEGKTAVAEKLTRAPSDKYVGGFHFAPGGNASARAGGDKPAINPLSVWDRQFRPACPDPRGMTRVEADGKTFWVDIYLLAADHLANGTSRFGVTIADGNDPPQNPKGGRFKKLDCAMAAAVMAHHGKGLLSSDEFYAAASGVTEHSSAKSDPKIAGLDAARTSKFGLMQATGNLWAWGHDGTSAKRASIFGGSWLSGLVAGSRYAYVAYIWPGNSYDFLGARGRSDHLQPG